MKKLFLFASLGLMTLIGTVTPANANPQGEALDTSEQNYVIDPATGEKIDPATGAIIEGTEDVVGEGETELMEDDAVIIEPDAESASDTGEEAPAE